MTTKLVIGMDGHENGGRAVEYAMRMAELIGDCELIVAYVVEWSPFSFQTPEENETRHKRREEEIATAMERVIAPTLILLTEANLEARGVVRHGDVAETLDSICRNEGAEQIIVNRASKGGISKRIFGSSTSNLVMNASVPVTVVN